MDKELEIHKAALLINDFLPKGIYLTLGNNKAMYGAYTYADRYYEFDNLQEAIEFNAKYPRNSEDA